MLCHKLAAKLGTLLLTKNKIHNWWNKWCYGSGEQGVCAAIPTFSKCTNVPLSKCTYLPEENQWLTVIVLQKYNIRSSILQYWLEIDWYHVVGTLSFMPWVSIFSKNRFIFWNPMFGIWVFYRNANVVFIEKSEFLISDIPFSSFQKVPHGCCRGPLIQTNAYRWY